MLEKRAGKLKAEVERLERVRRELRAEIVPYAKGGAVVRHADVNRFSVRVQRPSPGAQRPPASAQPPDPGTHRPRA
jgi:hypothetical protein